MKDILIFTFAFILGNCAGDTQTAMDCGRKGEAKMLNLGAQVVIKCEVLK